MALWDTARKYRLDYIHRKVSGKAAYCHSYLDTDVSMDYMEYFSLALNISHTRQTHNVYKEQMTDSLLYEGFQLFHYIARCEDMDLESTNTFKTYIDLFRTDSPIAILEAANVMNKQKTNTTSARNLMKKIHSEFGSDIYKLQVLSSTSDNLENEDDEHLRNTLQTCLKRGNCEDLKKMIIDQGANVF